MLLGWGVFFRLLCYQFLSLFLLFWFLRLTHSHLHFCARIDWNNIIPFSVIVRKKTPIRVWKKSSIRVLYTHSMSLYNWKHNQPFQNSRLSNYFWEYKKVKMQWWAFWSGHFRGRIMTISLRQSIYHFRTSVHTRNSTYTIAYK